MIDLVLSNSVLPIPVLRFRFRNRFHRRIEHRLRGQESKRIGKNGIGSTQLSKKQIIDCKIGPDYRSRVLPTWWNFCTDFFYRNPNFLSGGSVIGPYCKILQFICKERHFFKIFQLKYYPSEK